MSSIRNRFLNKAKKFQSGIDKYQVDELSIARISTLFKNFILCAKELIENNDNDQEDINVILDIIHKFLKCFIDYAGIGSASFKLADLRMFCHDISGAIECLQIKYDFLKNLSIPIFEILLDPELQSWIGKEILKMYSITVHFLNRSERSSIIEDKFSYYMARLMDLIPFVDYEFQVIIVEIIFRFYTKKELQEKENIFFFKTEEQKNAFYNIDTRKFDFSTRLFLNLVNDSEKNVTSVLCHKVYMDEFLLHEPDELSSFNGLWIDFNVKVGMISFYIDIRHYSEVTETDEAMWEIVTIFSENISRSEISINYNEETKVKEAIGKLKLKGPCRLLKACSPKLYNSRTIILYSTNVERMKYVFDREIPKMTRKKTKKMYIPLRRGYKPLDIISIKSSTTNPSSTMNHTFNTEMVCNERKRRKSTHGKHASINLSSPSSLSSMKSVDTNFENTLFIEKALYKFDHSAKKSSILQSINKNANPDKSLQSKENSKTNCYEETFLSQLMEIVPESKTRKYPRSYHNGEAFDATTELVAQNQNININKNLKASEYGEKFSSRLLQIEDMEFKDLRSASCRETFDAKFFEMDVPPSIRKEKAGSLSCKFKCQPIETEPDSTVLDCNRNSEFLLDEGPTSERLAVSSSSINVTPTEKPSMKINKRKRRTTISDENPNSDQIFRRTNMKEPLRESNRPDSRSSHQNDGINLIHEGEIDKYEAMKIKRVTVSVTHCSPDLFSSQIEISNCDENKPPNSESVNTKSLRNLDESPDPIQDPFDELKLEMPNRQVELDDNPNIDSNFEGPNFVEMPDPVADNTEFFETARMDLDGIEVPKSELHFRNSLEPLNIIPQDEHLSKSILLRNEDANSNSLSEYKSRIKILTNIKIQCSHDEKPKSNIHTQNEFKKMRGSHGQTFQSETHDIEDIRGFSEDVKNYSGLASSEETKMKKSDGNSQKNIHETSKIVTGLISDHSMENANSASMLKASNVELNQRSQDTDNMRSSDEKVESVKKRAYTSEKIEIEKFVGDSPINIYDTSIIDIGHVSNSPLENVLQTIEDTSQVVNAPNTAIPVSIVTASNVESKQKSQDTDCMQSFTEEVKSDKLAATYEEIEREKSVGDSTMNIHDAYIIDRGHVSNPQLENVIHIIEDTPQVVNASNTAIPASIVTASNVESKQRSQDVNITQSFAEQVKSDKRAATYDKIEREKIIEDTSQVVNASNTAIAASIVTSSNVESKHMFQDTDIMQTFAEEVKSDKRAATYEKIEREKSVGDSPINIHDAHIIDIGHVSSPPSENVTQIIEDTSQVVNASNIAIPASIVTVLNEEYMQKSQDTDSMQSFAEEVAIDNRAACLEKIEGEKSVADCTIKNLDSCIIDIDHDSNHSMENVVQISEDTSQVINDFNTAISASMFTTSNVESNQRSQDTDTLLSLAKEVQRDQKSSTLEKIEREKSVCNSPIKIHDTSKVDIGHVSDHSVENVEQFIEKTSQVIGNFNTSKSTSILTGSNIESNQRSQDTGNAKEVKSDKMAAASEEIEREKSVDDSLIKIHDTSIIGHVSNHSMKNFEQIIEDTSQVINAFNTSNPARDTDHMANLAEEIESTKRAASSGKIEKKKFVDNSEIKISGIPGKDLGQVSDHSICEVNLPQKKERPRQTRSRTKREDIKNINSFSPHRRVEIPRTGHKSKKRSQCMPNANYRDNVQIQVNAEKTTKKQRKEATITEHPKKITNKTTRDKYDVANEKPTSATQSTDHPNESFDNNPTKKKLRRKIDKAKNKTLDTNNAVTILNSTGTSKRRKLYNPDDPEETLMSLPEFMDSKITETSPLKPTSHYESKQNVSKSETEKKSKKGLKDLIADADKRISGSNIIKNNNSNKSKDFKTIKKVSSKDERRQTKHKGNKTHSNKFRLDNQFHQVLEKLKSGNYSSKKQTSQKKKTDNKKHDLYTLDFSMVKASDEIVEKKRNLRSDHHKSKREEVLPELELEDNSTKDFSIEENDRDLDELLRALGRLCSKFCSGKLIISSSPMKKKLISLSHFLLNI